MLRPDRSDAHLSPEEEARKAVEAREYFDGIAPKRHTKPQRSEYANTYTDVLLPSQGDPIPELDKLRELESHPEKLVCAGSEPVEEYVETEYYKDLNCVDKQHHTDIRTRPIFGGGHEKDDLYYLDVPSDSSFAGDASIFEV